MKNKILLKSFLTLTLIFAFSSFAQASNIMSNFSPDGTAFGPGDNNIALEDTNPTPVTIEPPTSSNMVATTLAGLADLSTTSWFYIIFILLLLTTFFLYNNKRESKRHKIIRV